ncbi:hypothetical protein THIX_60894 [Thiomonas sp. X19]|nr:hypothetical protein THIX_60894 [Thiomonas sp. X19]
MGAACLARVKTRAWIETRSCVSKPTVRPVSLGLKPGRGLKPFAVVPEGYRIEVSLGLKPGRGLKRQGQLACGGGVPSRSG